MLDTIDPDRDCSRVHYEAIQKLFSDAHLLNNYDLKEENNKIVRPGKKSSEPAKQIYFVADLGAMLGSTEHWFTELPMVGELPTGSKGFDH